MTTIEVEPQPRVDSVVLLPGGGQARRTEYVGVVWFDGKPEVSAVALQASGEVHLHGHLGWPAGVAYRIVALTPPDAVR